MNAYAMQEQIEQQKWDSFYADTDRQEWIDKRGDELLKEYPEYPSEFITMTGNQRIREGIFSTKAMAAYNEYITALAWSRAEMEWEETYGWLAG